MINAVPLWPGPSNSFQPRPLNTYQRLLLIFRDEIGEIEANYSLVMISKISFE